MHQEKLDKLFKNNLFKLVCVRPLYLVLHIPSVHISFCEDHKLLSPLQIHDYSLLVTE